MCGAWLLRFCKRVPYHKKSRDCFSKPLSRKNVIAKARINKLLFLSYSFYPLSQLPFFFLFPPSFYQLFLVFLLFSSLFSFLPITQLCFSVVFAVSNNWLVILYLFSSFSLLAFSPSQLFTYFLSFFLFEFSPSVWPPFCLLAIPPPFLSFHCQISCY